MQGPLSDNDLFSPSPALQDHIPVEAARQVFFFRRHPTVAVPAYILAESELELREANAETDSVTEISHNVPRRGDKMEQIEPLPFGNCVSCKILRSPAPTIGGKWQAIH